MRLARTQHGESGPPVIVLHGLFGSSRNWAGIARMLAASYRVIAADLRNHGDSPWTATMSFPEMAADVGALLDAEEISAARLVGHSLGGKVAMALALAQPQRVAALVVVDIAPVTYPRSHDETIAAMRAAPLERLRRRAEVAEHLARDIPDDSVRAFLTQNAVERDGRLAWRFNLDAFAANMDSLLGFPAFAGARYDGPALFVAGERSDYLAPQHHEAVRARFPAAAFATVADAGHWLHVEAPDAFLAELRGFLARTAGLPA